MGTPLKPQQLHAEGRGMGGALGAAAYCILKGLEQGGAETDVIASIRVLIQDHFQKLTDEDCNVLCDFLFKRLNDDAQKPGEWY